MLENNYFVEAFEYAKARGKRALIICDVDLALLESMSTITTEQQRTLIGDWFDMSGGNLFFMTGRAHQSLDQAWGRNLPGSYEHHSMMRIEENGEMLHLASRYDMIVVAETAIELIGDAIELVGTPEDVHDARGSRFVVYPEVKNASVALVHSQGLDKQTLKENRKFLRKQVAKPLLKKLGIRETHRRVVGGDAIEVAPNQHSLCELSEQILPKDEQVRIARDGLSKATGIHNIMGLYGDDVIPFMLGDSPGSDGPAMKTCIQYGGYGIAVENGNNLPDDFRMATGDRVIPNFQMTWDHVAGMVDHLKNQPANVVLMQRGPVAARG